MNNDWFEITTYSNDPTRIEMRRLSGDEAEQAKREYYKEQAMKLLEEYFPAEFHRLQYQFQELADNALEIAATLPTETDKKAEARARSKADLDQKRKQLIKTRGKR